MDRRIIRRIVRTVWRMPGGGARAALSLVLAFALVLAGVPTGSLRALAEGQGQEAEKATTEEPQAAQPTDASGDQQADTSASDPAQEQEQGSEQTLTVESKPIVVSNEPKNAGPEITMTASPSPIAADGEQGYDGFYNQCTVRINVKGPGIAREPYPTVMLHYHELGNPFVTTPVQFVLDEGSWADIGGEWVAAVTATAPGSYYKASISGVQTSAGPADAECAIEGLTIVDTPKVSRITLKDAQGETIKTPENKAFDLTEVTGTNTEEARSVEVEVIGGALDSDSDVALSKSQAQLIDPNGNVAAAAPFAPKLDDEGHQVDQTYVATIDHAIDTVDVPFGDGIFGVKVIAIDKFGNELKTSDEEPFKLYAATMVEEADGTKVAKADGTFRIDRFGPTLDVTYPSSLVAQPYEPTASSSVTLDKPSGSVIHFFGVKPTLRATFGDVLLDTENSTFAGVTLKEVLDATESPYEKDGISYVVSSNDAHPNDELTVNASGTCSDGVYAMSDMSVRANDSVPAHERSDVPNPEVDYFVVDTAAPEVTSASLGVSPATAGDIDNGRETGTDADGDRNKVFFFDAGGEAGVLTLKVKEPYGIQTIELDDPSGRYQLSTSAADGAQAINDDLLNAGHANEASCTYTLKVVDTLQEGVDFSDDVVVRITDFAGNQTEWSMRETGKRLLHELESYDDSGVTKYRTKGVSGTGTNTDLSYTPEGGSAQAMLHPTLLVRDNTLPGLTLSLEGSAAALPEHPTYFSSDQTVKLSVVEQNLKYLKGFTADAGEDVNGTYPALDTGRSMLTVTYTPDTASAPNAPVSHPISELAGGADGKTFNWSLGFAADGSVDGLYKVKGQLKDVVGNVGTADTELEFTIDTKPPVISVAYGKDPSDALETPKGDIVYVSGTRTATVTVAERNFDPALFTVTVTPANTEKDYSYTVPTTWGGSGDNHTLELTFDHDAQYTIEVTGKDMAGNVSCVKGDEASSTYTATFVVDTEPPVIATYHDNGTAPSHEFDAEAPALEFPPATGVYKGTNYYSHAVSLLAQVQDRNFDPAGTTLAVTKDGKETAQSVSWAQKPGERGERGYTRHQTTVVFDQDGEYLTPHIVSTDLTGDATHNRADNKADLTAFVVDLKAPTIKVTVDRTPSAQGKGSSSDPVNFYNRATKLTFAVSDEHLLRSTTLKDPSGLYNLTAADAEGKGSVTLVAELKDRTAANDAVYERDIVLTAEDLAGNVRTWTIDHNGTVKLDEKTTTQANTAINDGKEHPEALVQDTVAPFVALTGVTAGAYYNSTQVLTADVREFNLDWLQRFDGARVIVTITKYEGNAGRAKSSWTVSAADFLGKAPNYSYTEPFDSDGHYVIEAQFADYAGNLSNKAEIGEFTIDMTPPQISMAFDNNDVRNDKYYKAPRTATITVVEHNFDPNLITIETEGEVSGWSSNGDTHTCTIYFGEGGPYTVKVNGKDLAGNEGTEVSEPEFIVDLTAPEVKIAGTAQRLGHLSDSTDGANEQGLVNAYHGDLEDKSAYNGVVVPVITYKDNEPLVAADLAHTLSGTKHGDDIEHDSVVSEEGTEMTVTLADLGFTGEGAADGSNWEQFYVDDYAVDADDIYTLKATLTDQAGNEAEAELTFSVNRYGSNYDVAVQGVASEDLERYQASGMLSAAPTIVVREVNVSGVADRDREGNLMGTNHHVEKEFANATTPIALQDGKGAGYSLSAIDAKHAANGWSEYVYTVRSANFGEGSDSDHNDRGQGVYRVNVMSDDTSSNANTTADYWRSDARRTKATADGATAEFILDELGPAIDELDLPSHLSAGESYEASFHVTDDITSGNTVVVEIDGQELPASEVHGPSNGAGTFTFSVPAKAFNWARSIRVTVRDYAGREASERNGSWIWQSTFIPEAGIAALVAAVGVTAIVASRRRRDAAEPELPM